MMRRISVRTAGFSRVEIGLEPVETMKVVLARDRIARPGLFLHAGKHHALVVVRRPRLRPDIPVAIRRLRILSRRLKPVMPIRCVVDDQVDDHAQTDLLGVVHEVDELAERPELRVDAVVVRDVVAVVAIG